MIDEICRQIPDFYFGRLDIRYESRELLEQGKSFSIMEVNGAGSEPTHIYDPRHSFFLPGRKLYRHWMILYKISRSQSSSAAIAIFRFLKELHMFKKYKADSKILADMQNKTHMI